MVFFTSGSEALRIDSNGNIGINENSPSSFDSGARDLVVGNSGNAGILIKGGTSITPIFILVMVLVRQVIEVLLHTTTAKIHCALVLLVKSRCVSRRSGRLLVGVTQSFASANADNLQVGNNSAAVESGISLGSTIGSGIRFADAGNASAGIIEYVHADNSMRFFTDVTERMRIDSAGRVLINTTSAGKMVWRRI